MLDFDEEISRNGDRQRGRPHHHSIAAFVRPSGQRGVQAQPIAILLDVPKNSSNRSRSRGSAESRSATMVFFENNEENR